MAISDDTAALVAAQLTVAWASQMPPAGSDDAGKVGPRLVQVYRNFLSEISPPDADIDGYIASLKK